MNSAESYVDICKDQRALEAEFPKLNNNRLLHFLSESGKLEFFAFANSL